MNTHCAPPLQPEIIVDCETADEVDRAIAMGYTVTCSPEVAREYGAPGPDEPPEDITAEEHLYHPDEPPASYE